MRKQITLTFPDLDGARAWHFVQKWLLPNPGTIILVAILLFTVPTLARSFQSLNAASITTIPYQGRLANAAGEPLNDLVNMEFRLYDAPTGGTRLWTETWAMENSVRVTDGLFSVMLGSLNTNLASVVQSHSTLYLGIAVGNDSEMTPRVQLGSVPFSIWSLTVADNSVTSAKIAEGAVGSREIANGSVTVDEIAEGVVDINFKGVERRGVRMEAFESDTFSMGWQEGSTYDLIWVFPEPFTEPPLIVATSRELSYCRYINWDVWFVSTTEARFIGVRSVSQPDAQYFTSQCRLNVLAIGH